ncbi:hypothetical protein RhiLY_03417 [Ceratobasidium sp. AG-Ba]|nr:hypothetical protein RhiLY_03417 [Ceratobasidium sp. AG-Ba]
MFNKAELAILLQVLLKNCPQLDTLSAPCETGTGPVTVDKDILTYAPTALGQAAETGLEDSCRASLALIGPLVSFTTSSKALDQDSFTLISKWPLLEGFELVMDHDKPYEFPELSESAFPALKHLGIYRWRDEKIYDMFQCVPNLLCRLTSINMLPDAA